MLMAENNSSKIRILEEENIRLKRLLEERKLIERGKGILMKKEGLSEDEAYRRIQRLSMAKSKKMADIAEAIIITEEAGR